MPMLAEVKRKNKIGPNPRGTLWTNDENKFGQKLLEKMGWAKGKGLGKDEQGLQEPIKVKEISDQKGVGFKGNPDEWMKHCDAFEDVLANLNNLNSSNAQSECNTNEENPVDSLEHKSKKSRSRVHYAKFTRGKDLSLYNEDDLACVLGSRRKGEARRGKKEEEKEGEAETEREEIAEMDKSYGLTTVYGGSLKDYFSHKMDELKRKREEGLLGEGADDDDDVDPASKVPDLEFEPAKTDFSFNYSIQEPVEEEEEEEEQLITQDAKKEKKKKKKNKKEKERSEEAEEIGEQEESREIEKRKKKKKGKRNEDLEEVIAAEKESESGDGEAEKMKKKDRKRKRDEGVKELEEKENRDSNLEEIQMKKDKKKRKKENKMALEKIEEDEDRETKENLKNKIRDKARKRTEKEENKESEVEENKVNEAFLTIKEEFRKKKRKKSSKESERTQTEMNESYVEATRTEDTKRGKKTTTRGDHAATNEGEEESSPQRPLKKLRKLASEISLVDLFKGRSNDDAAGSGDREDREDGTLPREDAGDKREKRKLKSRKESFKELKSELGDKIRQKMRKRDKREKPLLEVVAETEEEEAVAETEEVAEEGDTVSEGVGGVRTCTIRERRPARLGQWGPQEPVMVEVACDANSLFPGSNLAAIKGYDEDL